MLNGRDHIPAAELAPILTLTTTTDIRSESGKLVWSLKESTYKINDSNSKYKVKKPNCQLMKLFKTLNQWISYICNFFSPVPSTRKHSPIEQYLKINTENFNETEIETTIKSVNSFRALCFDNNNRNNQYGGETLKTFVKLFKLRKNLLKTACSLDVIVPLPINMIVLK